MYYLLPFRFRRFHDRELLTSEIGNYLVVPAGTVERLVHHQLEEETPTFKNLMAGNFISRQPYPPLLDNYAVRLRTKKDFFGQGSALHIFVLTLRCNQNCSYCQASSQTETTKGRDMSEADLRKAIDLMFMSPSPALTMEFQGGESSLVPDLVETAVKYAEEKNQRLRKTVVYILCTNAIAIPDRLIRLCRDYSINISTSFDGPEFLHNHNRGKGDSHARFLAGLATLRTELGNERISALMTTSVESLKYPKEIVDAYLQCGFHRIFLRPLNPYGAVRNTVDWNWYFAEFLSFYRKSLEHILELNRRGVFFVEEFAAIVLRKILTPFSEGFVDLQSPAGIINGVVVYNYNGKVYASDESRMMAEFGDESFCLGSVNDDYEQLFHGPLAKRMAQLWCTEYIAGCSDCAFAPYCGADPVRNHTMQGDAYGFRPTSWHCRLHEGLIEYLFELLINRREEVLPIFQSWLAGGDDSE